MALNTLYIYRLTKDDVLKGDVDYLVNEKPNRLANEEAKRRNMVVKNRTIRGGLDGSVTIIYFLEPISYKNSQKEGENDEVS